MPVISDLSDKMKESIDNYGQRIQTLKDFQTSVRKRSGMYIGALQNKGMETEIREIFQNAVDQVLDPNSPANWVYLEYNEVSLQVVVMDNGLSLPYDDIIRIFTTPHTSKNFEVNKGEYSSGLNGIGAKAVNALSDIFVVEAYHYDGTAMKVEFRKGYPTTDKPVKIENKKTNGSYFQGTKITFIPDLEILQSIDLKWEEVYKLVRLIMSLTPIGSRLDFVGISADGIKHTETFINKDGNEGS